MKNEANPKTEKRVPEITQARRTPRSPPSMPLHFLLSDKAHAPDSNPHKKRKKRLPNTVDDDDAWKKEETLGMWEGNEGGVELT